MPRLYPAHLIACAILLAQPSFAEDSAEVSSVKITTLSTMLTEFQGIGEWGYAALVEVDGRRLLFDTGGRPDTVLRNARELGIDLSDIGIAVLSHNHWDHTGGLTTIRRTLREANPEAFSVTHVAQGIFLPRVVSMDALSKLPPMPREFVVTATHVRDEYESLGGTFVVHDEPFELYPGVWLTGPVPRAHPEKNWFPLGQIETEDGLVEDNIPEDMALVINTAKGLVVLTGCGHAGVVNITEYARKIANAQNVYAVIGGLHLMQATNENLAWTGEKLKEFGVQHLVGAHCTGIEAAFRLRDSAGLERSSAVVGAVGSTFTLEDGIIPGILAR